MALPIAVAIAVTATPQGAAAGGGSFSTPGKNIDQIDPGKPVKSGDWISVGFAIRDHNSNNAALDVYLENAHAVITWTCIAKGATVAGQSSIAIPTGPYHYPKAYTANGGWFSTNQWADPSTYQVAVQRPASVCGGAAAYVLNNGETYSGVLATSISTSDLFHIQLHTAIPDAVGHGNTDCASTSQNPSPGVSACNFKPNGDQDNLSPTLYSAPAPSPTSTPTPAPSPAPSPSPDPSPGSSPAAGGSGSGTSGETGAGSGPLVGLEVIGAGTGSSGNSSAAPSRGAITSSPANLPAQGPPTASEGQSGVQGITGAPPPLSPLLQPLHVVAQAATNASHWLFAQLPMGWFALLVAIDVLLTLAIIARRRRARTMSPTATEDNQGG